MSLDKCGDCGRLIAGIFPVHKCDPTAAWKKENPDIRFIAKASGVRYGGGYLRKRTHAMGYELVPKQRGATRFSSRFAAEAAAERYDSVSPPPVIRLRLGRKQRGGLRCAITDCTGKVMVRLSYVSKKTGEKNAASYCLTHGEIKVSQFRKLAKDGKVTIDKSPQKAMR